MLTRVIGPVISNSPRLRRALWKGWYQFIARRLQQDDWTFMNYGYADTSGNGQTVRLEDADEGNRWSIQLYHKVVGGNDLTGKDVLEVGSGRGGGSSYVARYLKPKSMLGIDYSDNAVTLSRNLHKSVGNLAFQQGDAEALPCTEGSFDAVINVESSHCYSSMEQFLREVARVLRPGGHFLWVDMRAPSDRETVRAQFQAAGLEVVQDEDITQNVVRALDHVSDQKRAMIGKHVPKVLASYFEDFAGVPGTRVYESLRAGQVSYLRFEGRKPLS